MNKIISTGALIAALLTASPAFSQGLFNSPTQSPLPVIYRPMLGGGFAAFSPPIAPNPLGSMQPISYPAPLRGPCINPYGTMQPMPYCGQGGYGSFQRF